MDIGRRVVCVCRPPPARARRYIEGELDELEREEIFRCATRGPARSGRLVVLWRVHCGGGVRLLARSSGVWWRCEGRASCRKHISFCICVCIRVRRRAPVLQCLCGAC